MPIFLWPGVAPDTDICGQQAQPSLEPFEAEGARGAVLVCPGGGYHGKAGHEGAPVAGMLRAMGFSAYVLDYRIKPFRIETPLNDALRAVRLLRSMGYGRVAVMGFSAGGHLAAMAATLYDPGDPEAEDPVERFSSRPDAFVSCYGATSFRACEPDRVRRTLGEQYSEACVDRFSAEMNVTEDTPPAFIWHTADDGLIPARCSLLLASALSAHGVSYEMHIYPHGRHGLCMAEENPVVHAWCGQLKVWLENLGFGPEK